MAENDKIEELSELVLKDSTNFQARRELVVELMQKGFNEEALKHLYILLKTFPEDSRLHYNAAIVLENLKKYDKAIISYKNALKLQPEEPDFIYNLGYAYLQTGELDTALPYFKKVLEIEPEDANSYFNMGYIFSKKQEHELAYKCMERALLLNKEDHLACFLENI